jgi:PGF-pre-PGF domain-containing protein
MAYKRYIKRGKNLYGPYIYSSQKVNGKVISTYRGKVINLRLKENKILNSLIIGLIIALFFFVFSQAIGVLASSFDQNDNRSIGYEFLNSSGGIVDASQGETVHIWNTQDNYYFNKSSGIQLTNHFQDYWTKNIFCLGYYSGAEWIKIKCADDLSGFSRTIATDNATYVNATLWKDISYSGYNLRLAVNYYLGLNDKNLTVTVYGKNIGIDIPYELGFAWKVQNFEIPGETQYKDYMFINDTDYALDGTYDLLFQNMTKSYTNIDNPDVTVIEPLPFFKAHDGAQFLKLDWDPNLNYAVKMYGNGNQSDFYISILVNAGIFNAGQEKSTKFYWIDAFDITAETAFEFDTFNNLHNSMVKINNTHYLVTYQGANNDGFAAVLEINSSLGIINRSQYIFDVDGSYNSLVQIDESHYLNIYNSTGSNGTAMVLGVNLTNWTISNLSSMQFDNSTSNTQNKIVKINNTHYLVTHVGDAGYGFARVLYVNPADWSITQVSWLPSFVSNYVTPSLVKINNTHYITAYQGNANRGRAEVLYVNLTDWAISAVSTVFFDYNSTTYFSMEKINDTHYFVIYGRGTSYLSYATILQVDNSFTVTNVTEPTQITGLAATFHSMVKINDTHYLDVFRNSGAGNDGFAMVLEVLPSWTVNNVSMFEFDISDDSYNSLVQINQTQYINAYQGLSSDGFAVGLTIDVPISGGDNSPTVTLNTPADNYNSSSKDIIFNATAYDDINLTNMSLYGNWTGSWIANLTNSTPANNTLTNFSITGIPEGRYRWNVYACDNSSNCAFAGANRTFTVDVTSPIAEFGTNIANNTNRSNSSVTFDLRGYDNVGLSYLQLYGNWTGSWISNQTNITPANATYWNVTVDAIPNGKYIWAVWTNDTLNNQAFSTTNRTFTIDTVAPIINLSDYANGTIKANTDTLILNVSVTDATTNSVACKIDINGTNQTSAVSSGWCNITNGFLTNLADGNKTINVYVNDSAGNWGLNNSFVVKISSGVDNPPQWSKLTINNTVPGEIVNHRAYWTEDTNLSGYIFSFDNGTGTFTNDTWVAMTGTTNWSNVTKIVNLTANSVIRWIVYANDSAGQLNATSTQSYTINTPVLSLQNQSGVFNVSNEVNVNISIYNITNLSGVQINVSYNSSVLSYNRTEEGTFLSENGAVSTYFNNSAINTTTGNINYIIVFREGENDGATGEGVISSMYFNATNSGTSYINITSALLSSNEAESISYSTSNTTIVVNSGPDSSSPTVTLNTPVDNYNSSSRDIIFNATAYDDINLTNMSLYGNWTGSWIANLTNSTPANNTLTNFSITGIPEGRYRWNVYACDNSSNCAFAGANRTFTVDVTSPISEFGTNIADNTNRSNSSVTFDLRGYDNVGLSYLQLYGNWTGSWIANQTNITPANETYWNVTVDAIPNGKYVWAVWTNDTLNNQAFSTTNRTFTIDTVAPVISLPSYANGTIKANTDTLILNVSVTDATTNSVACKIDINGTNQTSAVSSGWCNITNGFLTNLADGNKTINVYVNDSAGNWGLNNSFVVKIDANSPISEFGTNIANNTNRSNSSVTFDLRGYDNVGLSYLQLYGNWTGSWISNQTNITPANATYWNVTVDAIPNGKYIWAVWANDTLNNQAFSTANRTFTIDTVAPIINLSDYANGTIKANTDTLTLNVSVTDATTNSVACKIDINGTNQTSAVSSGWCNITNGFLTNLADGNRTINIYVNDSAGNWGLNNSFVVKIDTNSPIAEFGTNIANNTNRSNSSVTFDLRGYDNVGLSYLQLYGNWTGSWISNQTNITPANATYWNVTVDAIPNGKYIWAVWANDTLNNQAFSTANRTFTIDTVAPYFTAIANQTIAASTNLIYDINATDTTIGLGNFSINDTTNFSINYNTGLVTNATVLLTGYYLLNVTVNDTLGNLNWSFWTVNVSTDNANPGIIINSPSSGATLSSSNVTINISFSDNMALDYCSYNITNSIGGTVVANNSIICTTNSVEYQTISDGSNYVLIAFANDTSGNSNITSKTFSIDTSTTPPGGSGNSGGGSTPRANLTNATNETETEASLDIKNITAGNSVIFSNFSSESDIRQIEVQVNSVAENVKITVSSYDSVPENVSVEKDGKVYRYLHIETENLDDRLEKATIDFEVPKTWIEENSVQEEAISFFRYLSNNLNWTEIQTIYTSSDDIYYYYQTELNSFSYFAIAEKKVLSGKESTFSKALNTLRNFFSGNEKLFIGIIMILMLIIIIILIIISISRLRKPTSSADIRNNWYKNVQN